MRLLVVGACGTGDAISRITARRDFFDEMAIADADRAKARAMTVAQESLATEVWQGTDIRGSESFGAVPFLDLLVGAAPTNYDSPWGIEEK